MTHNTPMAMEQEEITSLLLNEQREAFMAAKTLESDLQFAFSLQIQEAINASLNHQSNPSTSHSPPPPPPPEDDVFDYTNLLLADLDRLDQERRDREQCQAETMNMIRDLDRRIHDQQLASEIKGIPDAEWQNDGDFYEKPYSYDDDKNKLNVRGTCRIYFKGMVSEERIRDTRVMVGGIGVAICDPRDNLVFEFGKALEDAETISNERAQLEALVHGLTVAKSLNLDRICFLVDDYMVYQYVTQRCQPGQSKIATLVHHVASLQQQFTYCQPSYVAQNDIKFAFKLARDAIVSQIIWPIEASGGKRLKETCAVCFEDVDVAQMFSVDGCLHRYCFSCMKQHVEAKLLNGIIAKCPYEGCKSDIDVDSCGKFLDTRLVEIMSNRMKEASIAVTEKVYCPNLRCSALMSKHDVLDYTKSVIVDAETFGARKCLKCNLFFCINCKVPWHYNLTCNDYKSQPNPDDAMVKSLAQSKRWRQCVKCNHMVELLEGCYHITCRCGHEFCYTCGAEWKSKKPTCKCPIWDERNIIRGGRPHRQGPRR